MNNNRISYLTMEFSEYTELYRLVNSKSKGQDASPLTSLIHSVQSKIQKTKKTEQSRRGTMRVLSPVCDSINNSESSDDSYLTGVKSRGKSLASASKLSVDTKVSAKSAHHLKLKIFFFNKNNFLNITVPYEITVRDTIVKALIAYEKDHIYPLPNGINEQGYDMYLVDEEYETPDTDFIIDHSSFIAPLKAKVFLICEKPEFQGSIYNSYGSLLEKVKPGTDWKFVRFIYKNNSTVVKVKPEQKISDLLQILEKKFSEKFSYNLIEFRVMVKENGGECVVNSELMFKELDHNEFWVYRKVLVDSSPCLLDR